MPAPSFVACTLCYKGSKKPRGHQGKHKTTKTTKSKKKRLARGQSECTECAPRSGNPEGHRGRHKGSTHPRKTPAQSRALKRKRESVAAQRAQTGPCTKCCDGAGKESGHRGRHATVISEKKRKVLRSECEACFVGSGKEQGHRGAFAHGKSATVRVRKRGGGPAPCVSERGVGVPPTGRTRTTAPQSVCHFLAQVRRARKF